MSVMLERWNDDKMDALSGKVDDLGDRMDKGLECVIVELRAQRAETKTEFAAVRGEMKTESAAMRAEMKTESAALRDECPLRPCRRPF